MSSTLSSSGLGLALGGGGARGVIHVGVLKALEEEQIRPMCIAGVSIGAIVGGFYASGLSANDLLKHFRNQSLIKMFRLRASLSSFLEMKYLDELLDRELPHEFGALEIPFFAGVTNLEQRSHETLSDGDLHKAITASASIPILFPPVDINGCKYVDGGLTDNLPSAALQDRCSYILAVDVNNIESPAKLGNVRDIAFEVFHTAIESNSRYGRMLADDLIRPRIPKGYDLLDFSKSEALFGIGYRAAREWIEGNADTLADLRKRSVQNVKT